MSRHLLNGRNLSLIAVSLQSTVLAVGEFNLTAQVIDSGSLSLSTQSSIFLKNILNFELPQLSFSLSSSNSSSRPYSPSTKSNSNKIISKNQSINFLLLFFGLKQMNCRVNQSTQKTLMIYLQNLEFDVVLLRSAWIWA